jgi:hypothetical protein
MWKVCYNPAPIHQPFFQKGYDSGADVHRLIAHRPFDLISAFQKTMYIYSRAYVIGVDLARLL